MFHLAKKPFGNIPAIRTCVLFTAPQYNMEAFNFATLQNYFYEFADRTALFVRQWSL
jgi:hypothetical protein